MLKSSENCTALLLSNYRQVTLETQLVNIVTMAFSRYWNLQKCLALTWWRPKARAKREREYSPSGSWVQVNTNVARFANTFLTMCFYDRIVSCIKLVMQAKKVNAGLTVVEYADWMLKRQKKTKNTACSFEWLLFLEILFSLWLRVVKRVRNCFCFSSLVHIGRINRTLHCVAV